MAFVWKDSWLALFTVRTSTCSNRPVKQLLWYFPMNNFIQHPSQPTSQVAPCLHSHMSMFHTQACCDDSCVGTSDLKSQQAALWHWSLWLQPLRSINRYPATLTQGINVMLSPIHPQRAAERWELRSTLTLLGKGISPSDDWVTPQHYDIIDVND